MALACAAEAIERELDARFVAGGVGRDRDVAAVGKAERELVALKADEHVIGGGGQQRPDGGAGLDAHGEGGLVELDTGGMACDGPLPGGVSDLGGTERGGGEKEQGFSDKHGDII